MVFCILPPQRIVKSVKEEVCLVVTHADIVPGALPLAAMTSVLEGLVGRALFDVVVFSANTSCY